MKTEKTDSPSTPYRHLLWFALAYGAVAGFSIFAVAVPLLDRFPLLYGVAMLLGPAIWFTTIVLTAAWSVFGPGGYLKRVALSHCVALVVVGGTALGLGVVWLSITTLGYGPRDQGLLTMIGLMVLGIPGVSMAAQLPFWFFRVFFGWQFVHGEADPVKSFSLRDGFAVTFLFAIACAAPQFAVNFEVFNEQADNLYDTKLVTLGDGTERDMEVRIADQEEIASRRREFVQDRNFAVQMGFGAAAAYAIVISLLGLPIVLIAFRSATTKAGCAWTLFYLGGWGLAFLIFVAATNQGMPGLGEQVFSAGLSFALMGTALWLPLAVSGRTGFRLTSPKRHQRELLEAKTN